MTGKVYIVGAGPGNPELLTIKALKVIEKADVILYDRLIGKEMVEMLKKMNKKLIYVGKENKESGEERQNEINELMKKFVSMGKIVVRLKGGDPFIYGRGGVEAEFLARNKIPFEIIPGLTSINAVPTYAGIPLTHPNISSSIFVITGRNLEDIGKSALDGTIVILMGRDKIRMICKRLIELGKDPDTPVAVIENGTLKDQRVFFSNLRNIADIVEKEVRGPALIVVGEVVKIGEKISSKISSSL